MAVETATAALMLSTVTAVPSIMGSFTVKPADIVAGSSDPAHLSELRRGEIIGAGVSLALAGVLASVVSSPEQKKLVFVMAVAMIAVFVLEQERAIRRSPHVEQEG